MNARCGTGPLEAVRSGCYRVVAKPWQAVAPALLAAVLLAACAPAPEGASNDTAADTGTATQASRSPPKMQRPPTGARTAIDRAIAAMDTAHIAFNTPTTLNLQDTREVELQLSLRQSIAELRRQITAPGATEGANVRVSDRMEARLAGPNFDITPLTSEEQAVGSDDAVSWKWDIKPLATGPQRLHLTLTALLSVEGATMRRSLRTFDKTIDVQVTARQRAVGFVHDNWQWLWAVVLAPMAGWLWRRRGSRDREPEHPPDR